MRRRKDENPSDGRRKGFVYCVLYIVLCILRGRYRSLSCTKVVNEMQLVE